MKVSKVEIQVGGRKLTLETGKVAKQASGSVLAYYGESVVLGAVVGSFILGVYLFVSIDVMGRHSNEAFSSLRIQDYKQWLRLRIDASGALTIYAIAIDRVPRRWRAQQRNGEQTWVANDARATPPRLIDKVVVHP